MTIAKHLEHTLLKPEATVEDIMQLCSEARKYGLFGVCVNPCYVGLARHLLSDTNVKVVTVVGFPLGATFSEVKALETKMAVEAHADEIDMVMNVSAFKTGDYAAVVSDIRSVVEAASPFPVKEAVRDDLHRLWKVKSCVDTAARFNERTEEQKLQNRPQTRQKKEELSR